MRHLNWGVVASGLLNRLMFIFGKGGNVLSLNVGSVLPPPSEDLAVVLEGEALRHQMCTCWHRHLGEAAGL